MLRGSSEKEANFRHRAMTWLARFVITVLATLTYGVQVSKIYASRISLAAAQPSTTRTTRISQAYVFP